MSLVKLIQLIQVIQVIQLIQVMQVRLAHLRVGFQVIFSFPLTIGTMPLNSFQEISRQTLSDRSGTLTPMRSDILEHVAPDFSFALVLATDEICRHNSMDMMIDYVVFITTIQVPHVRA